MIWGSGERWFRTEANGGTVDYGSSASEYGIMKVISAALANSDAFATLGLSSALGDYAPFLPGGSGGEWYMSGRFKLLTTPATTAVTMAGMGAYDEALQVGAWNTTTNFVARFPTGVLTSTLAIDNNWHVHRISRKAGVTQYDIDLENRVTGDHYPTSPAGLSCFVRNSSSTASHTLLSNWIFVAIPENVA